MSSTLRRLCLAIVLAGLGPAQAGPLPVVDSTAISNLVKQVNYWQQQIAAMSSQLNQLQRTYGAMTGGRGMEGLLPATALQRNYLPADYAQLMATVNGQAPAYAGLTSQIQAVMAQSAVLSNEQLGAMSPDMRQLIEANRRSSATVSALTQAAYRNTSQRFAALQQMISMIGVAGDAKAIADLQARVASEQAMLQNEQTKLQLLQQMAQADQWRQQQQLRERSAADVGSIRALSGVPY